MVVTIINKITHRAKRIQWEYQTFFISIDEAMLHVITQSDFNEIYKILFI